VLDLTAGPGASFVAAFHLRNIWIGSNTTDDFFLEQGLHGFIQEMAEQDWSQLETLREYGQITQISIHSAPI
jgi:hypothetical protein